MPPRKKQRTESTTTKVPPRTTRTTTRAARNNIGFDSDAAPVANEQEASEDDSISKSIGPAPAVAKRIVLKGRLQTLPELAIEIQLMASISFSYPYACPPTPSLWGAPAVAADGSKQQRLILGAQNMS